MYEETNADPNSIGTEAQTSWSLANVGVKVRNKNETAKPFGNFYDFLALLVEISSDGGFSPQTPRCFLVLDYLFSSTRKLQFYVEVALYFNKSMSQKSLKSTVNGHSNSRNTGKFNIELQFFGR